MTATDTHDRVRRLQNTETALRLVAATGLLIDAAVHLHLAHRYDPLVAVTVSQGALFRVEAAAATLAMALVLVRRRAAADLYALAVAAGGLAALLLDSCADIGTLGPLPGMYEPSWPAAKTLTACGQGIAAAALLALAAGHRRHHP
ncbi:hypothetical protein ACIQWA_07015 [Kitasatospora sp. NPDC098652]|uniref:hypothetical protein n=1 Tax=Kitasatospora sp. NPDC098652 TaxID=3364095 RepID=UPI00380E6DF0